MTSRIRDSHSYITLVTQNLRNLLKGVYVKVKNNLGKVIVSGIYEGVVIKYLYDLHRVLTNPYVSGTVWKGRLPISPVSAELFPWPTLFFDLEFYYLTRRPISPIIIFTRPMSEIEYCVKFFYDNLILQATVIALPFMLYGICYVIKKRKCTSPVKSNK